MQSLGESPYNPARKLVPELGLKGVTASMELPLSRIIVDLDINPRDRIHRDWVEDLADNIDAIDPVVVVGTPEGDVLADGFHRYYACQRAGKETIEAERRRGTRQDARDLAIILNLRHGMKLSHEERRQAIIDYHERHPALDHRELARTLNLDPSTVRDALEWHQQTKTVERPLAYSEERELARSNLPPPQKERLREAAREARWTKDDLRQALETVESPEISEEYKERVMRREAPPVTFTRQGEPAFTEKQVMEMAHKVVADDIGVRFARGWKAAMELGLLEPFEVLANADKGALEMIVRNGPSHVDWMQRLIQLAREKLEIIDEVDR